MEGCQSNESPLIKIIIKEAFGTIILAASEKRNGMEGKPILTNVHDTISLVELKRLLYALKDSNSGILIRLRMLGQMWQPNFSRIFLITDNGAVMIDHTTKKTEIVHNLNQVVQFELETGFQAYQPFYHYNIQP